ncbi:MAG: cobyrinate a,c-diamide synthase [Pseudomonadota bacterium]
MTGTLGSPNAPATGLVIAAPSSNSGKTTITLGLCRALKRRGLSVQPFKCGPDYIDPAHHTAAAGRPSYNLDTWAMAPALVEALTARGRDADICIAEGVMGLFDGSGSDGQTASGSTADLAAFLGWPVVLVVDVSGQTETAAAVALGCATFRDDVRVAGIILNRVASERHLRLIKPGFERVGIPVLGAVFRGKGLMLPERHLGLVQAGELSAADDVGDYIDAIADTLADQVDLDALVGLARPDHLGLRSAVDDHREAGSGIQPPGQHIAIARDDAFSFIYAHMLWQWRHRGAELSFFSPLANDAPHSDADAVWLPGGYPELHAGRLAAAATFKQGMRDLAAKSVPIHGECGGYMVLGRGLEDAEGHTHEMLGLLDLETSYAKRKLHLGYRVGTLLADGVLGRKGGKVIGHEFHYASTQHPGATPLVDCVDARGVAVPEAGSRSGSVSGTFFHVVDVV